MNDNEFRIGDVPLGSALLVGDVAVFNVDGRLFAMHDKCTHKEGPMSDGAVEGTTVTCPYHGAQFDLETGAVLCGPAKQPLRTYRVVIDGDIGRLE